jgi:hypothetical protein
MSASARTEEQITHLLTEVDEQRRLIAVLAYLVLCQGNGGGTTRLKLASDLVEHLGHCVTGRARLDMNRQGDVVVIIEKGHH